MRFGITFGYLPSDELLDLARAADQGGIHVIQLLDHVLFPEEFVSPYPYKRSGRPPFHAAAEFPDVFVTMGYLAAATQRVHFMTGVFVLPLRHPVHVAKAASTAAVLSGGRIELGIGTGWMREEFDILHQQFANRGRRTDEAIDVLRRLWSAQPVSHDGDYYRFPPITMSPSPKHAIPLYIGGESAAAQRRAVRLGDGAFTLPHRMDTLLKSAADIRLRLEAAGRNVSDFEIIGLPTDAASSEDYRALERGGITTAIAPLDLSNLSSAAARLDAVRRFAIEVVEPASSA